MNKKLLALLFAVAVAPLYADQPEAGAGEPEAPEVSFFEDISKTLGITRSEVGRTDENEIIWGRTSDQKWNLATLAIPGAMLLAIGGILFAKGYKDKEHTWKAIKACTTFDMKTVLQIWETDKPLVLAIYAAMASLVTVAGRLSYVHIYKRFWPGAADETTEEPTATTEEQQGEQDEEEPQEDVTPEDETEEDQD